MGRTRRGWLGLTGGICMLIVAVVSFAALQRNAPSCAPGGASLSAYEWRISAWSSRVAAQDLVAAAEELCLDTVYVDVTGLADEDQHEEMTSSLEVLLDIAAESPVHVGALAGDPWWTSAEGLADTALVLRRLDLVNARSDAAIDSIHVDVEPWGLDEWAEDKMALAGDYLDFVDAIVDVRNELEHPGVHLSFLIPHWFDGSNGGAPMVTRNAAADYPFQHLDAGGYAEVSWIVMAYRDRAGGDGGVIELLSDELTRSDDVGLALETAPVDPRSITFADEEIVDLARELSIIRAAELGLVEVVINDVEHLRLLAERGSILDATPTG